MHRAHPSFAAALLATAVLAQAERAAGVPADAPAATLVAVANGVVRDGAVDFARLGLGDGGTRAEHRTPGRTGDGAVTRGGVRIQLRDVGVKLTFASGAELLAAADGRILLRDGSRTLPSPAAGLRLRIADGTVVDLVPSGADGRPFDFVGIHGGGLEPTVLHERGNASRRVRDGRAFAGRELHVLGDGRALYTAIPLGPLVVLDRMLAPVDAEPAVTPPRAVVVVGDLLAVSLSSLDGHAKLRAANDPDLQRRCAMLARLAARLFPPGTRSVRAATAVGEPVVPLPGGMHLAVEVRGTGPLALALHAPDHSAPLVEWTVTNTTHLHVVTADPERSGGIRYAMQGMDLGSAIAPLWGGAAASASDVTHARERIRAIGAAAPTSIPVPTRR